jgi:hypothetical protein
MLKRPSDSFTALTWPKISDRAAEFLTRKYRRMSTQDREDCTQETLKALWVGLQDGTFSAAMPETELTTLTRTIAKRKAVDLLRRRIVQARHIAYVSHTWREDTRERVDGTLIDEMISHIPLALPENVEDRDLLESYLADPTISLSERGRAVYGERGRTRACRRYHDLLHRLRTMLDPDDRD